VWHHAEGAPPRWEIPALPRDGFPSPFRHVSTLADHPQEIVENTVDTGHFGALHGYRNARVRRPFRPNGPFFAFAASAERAIPLGGSVEVLFDIVAHGLGHIWATATLPRLRIAAVFQAMATPLDPLHVEIRFSVALRMGATGANARAQVLSGLLTSMLGPAFRRDLAQDFPVWEHKAYLDRPRLAKGDGPIGAYRSWAQQFYSSPAETAGHRETTRISPVL
jgi:hypothetical protein